MADLDDVRATGAEVSLAYEGYLDQDGTVLRSVYHVSHPGEGDEGGHAVYLEDSPEAIAAFLEGQG